MTSSWLAGSVFLTFSFPEYQQAPCSSLSTLELLPLPTPVFSCKSLLFHSPPPQHPGLHSWLLLLCSHFLFFLFLSPENVEGATYTTPASPLQYSIPEVPGSDHIPREHFLNVVALVTCLPVFSPKAACTSPMIPTPETLNVPTLSFQPPQSHLLYTC